MRIKFGENEYFHVPYWLYDNSIYLKRRDFNQDYLIDKISKNEEYKNVNIWNIFKEDIGINVIEMFRNIKSFLSLWKFLEMEDMIGTYIVPKRFTVKKRHVELESMLYGFQKLGLTSIPYEKKMIDESIEKNDYRWLKWGIKYVDYRDWESWDEISFQKAIDNNSIECIDVILEYDFDIFEEWMMKRYSIELEEDMETGESIMMKINEKLLNDLEIT